MIVKEITLSAKGIQNFDYRNFLQINVDGKKIVRFLDGEPEDANLSRDFNGCYKIVDLMELAYEAGRKGENFIYNSEEVDDLEGI